MYPYIHWPQSTYIGTTLRPKYILFGYMDPQGNSSIRPSCRRHPAIASPHGTSRAVVHSGLPAAGFRRHRLLATSYADLFCVHCGWNARLTPSHPQLLHPHLLEVGRKLAQLPLRRTMSPSDPRAGTKALGRASDG